MVRVCLSYNGVLVIASWYVRWARIYKKARDANAHLRRTHTHVRRHELPAWDPDTDYPPIWIHFFGCEITIASIQG